MGDRMARLRPCRSPCSRRGKARAEVAAPEVLPTQVKEDRRIFRGFSKGLFEQAQVAFHLASADGRVVVARVINDRLAAANDRIQPLQGRQDLLVDRVLPADLRVIAKHSNVVGD